MKSFRPLILPLACLLGLLAPASALAAEEDFLYDPGTVSVLQISLSAEAIQKLEADPFTYVKGGSVSVTPTDGTPPADGKGTPTVTVNNVQVKLKGQLFGSFEDLGGKAAFKLKFKDTEPLFGLRKLTLNNMTQDPSMIHESLAYTAFAAAGVPASRSGYAYVWLNGKNYGLHLNLESLDTVSLPKIFAVPSFDKESQHLYEAAKYGADFYPGKESFFEVDEGKDETPADIADLTALIGAVDAAAPTGAIPPGLAAMVDLPRMSRMWAVEKYIGHWDGYAGEGIPGETEFNEHRPNNYYLYSEPSGRFTMLPWGTDQAWDVGDTGGVPMKFDGQDGRLFDLCLEDEDCAGLFSTGVANALEKVGGLDLEARATTTAALLAPWQALEEAPRKPFSSTQIASAVARTREFIEDRPAEAKAWLAAHPPPAVEPPPLPPVIPVDPVDAGAVSPSGTGPAAGASPAPKLGVGPVRIAGGSLGTRVHLPGAGIAVQRATISTRRGEQLVCGDRVEADRDRFATLRCRLSDAVLERLRFRWLRLSVLTTFTPAAGAAEADSRQVRLPRR